jgi:hypothetical protein
MNPAGAVFDGKDAAYSFRHFQQNTSATPVHAGSNQGSYFEES